MEPHWIHVLPTRIADLLLTNAGERVPPNQRTIDRLAKDAPALADELVHRCRRGPSAAVLAVSRPSDECPRIERGNPIDGTVATQVLDEIFERYSGFLRFD